MKNFKSILALIILISLTTIGCKKGDTGPIGPAGAQGPAGANGTNGSSNVSIQHFSISPGNWSTYNTYNLYYNTSVSVPTTDVCMIYFSTDNSSFRPLPSSYFESGDNLNYDFQTGYYIQVLYYNANGVSGKITQTLYFNVADIPPSQKIAHPNVNYSNYEDVKRAFHLEN